MPARGVHPLGIVHSFLGRAAPALHNANIGDRRAGCPHPARRNIGARERAGRPRGRSTRQFWVTEPFSIFTSVFGAPSWPPSTVPALAISSSTFRPAASILPNGVYVGVSGLSL